MTTEKKYFMKLVILSLLTITLVVSVLILIPGKGTGNMTFRQRVLKKIYPLVMKTGKTKVSSKNDSSIIKTGADFYALEFLLNDGTPFQMSSLKGKKVLIVNTASDCGYTGQYADLQKLFEVYKDKLSIIAFPANDFANQESGTDEKIAGFCKKNYGVTFHLAKKSVVIKNEQQHEVYKWLTNAELNGWNNQAPTWNFCKYLIDEKGELRQFYNSSVSPLDQKVTAEIEK